MLLLDGDWKGHWASSRKRHAGPISAVFQRMDAGYYRVRFTGWFLKVLPFWYTAKLTIVEESEEIVRLTCTRKLGFWFGTFTMHAEARVNEIAAEYSARKDVGRFTLSRVSR